MTDEERTRVEEYTREIGIEAITTSSSLIKGVTSKRFLWSAATSIALAILFFVGAASASKNEAAFFLAGLVALIAFVGSVGGYIGCRYAYRDVSIARAILVEMRSSDLGYKPKYIPWREI